MNGRCQEVCPVAIPLPTLLRGWRDRSWREGLEPASVRAGLGLVGLPRPPPAPLPRRDQRRRARRCAMLTPRRLDPLDAAGRRAGPAERDFPAPPGRTFMEQYKAGKRR